MFIYFFHGPCLLLPALLPKKQAILGPRRAGSSRGSKGCPKACTSQLCTWVKKRPSVRPSRFERPSGSRVGFRFARPFRKRGSVVVSRCSEGRTVQKRVPNPVLLWESCKTVLIGRAQKIQKRAETGAILHFFGQPVTTTKRNPPRATSRQRSSRGHITLHKSPRKTETPSVNSESLNLQEPLCILIFQIDFVQQTIPMPKNTLQNTTPQRLATGAS